MNCFLSVNDKIDYEIYINITNTKIMNHKIGYFYIAIFNPENFAKLI